MKIVKQGTSEYKEILDRSNTDVVKKELSDDVDKILRSYSSGKGQEVSAIEKLVSIVQSLDKRVRAIETKS